MDWQAMQGLFSMGNATVIDGWPGFPEPRVPPVAAPNPSPSRLVLAFVPRPPCYRRRRTPHQAAAVMHGHAPGAGTKVKRDLSPVDVPESMRD